MRVIKFIFTIIVLFLSFVFYRFVFLPDHTKTIGIIDRIEDSGQAVILIESEEKQIEMHENDILGSAKEGDVLEIIMKDEAYEEVRFSKKLTKERKEEIRELLEKMKRNSN